MKSGREGILCHVCVETHQNRTLPATIRGGYRQDLLEHILTPLERSAVVCCSCEGVMRDPNFTDKGYKCGSCLDGGEGREATVNKTEIDKLRVHCPFKEEGCGWSSTMGLLVSHVEVCDLCPVSCRLGCGQILKRKYLERHEQEECPERITECEFCGISQIVSQLSDHLDTCPDFPLECTNGCDTDRILRKDLRRHISEYCPLTTVPCPYKKYGCGVLRKRKDLDSHETKFVVKHVRLMDSHINTINSHIATMNTHQRKMEEAIQQNKGLNWRITGIRRKFELMQNLYSDAFYVNNYKFGASVQFDTEEEDALGIYVHLCVGVLDDSLKWPFIGKVLIRLRNFQIPSDTITRSFLTEETDIFTRRTEDNMSGYGFHSFATKDEVLTELSKSDAITIQIEIQHTDTPRKFKQLTS